MAYYRRRRTRYRRRGEGRGWIKVIAVLLVMTVCAAAVVQTIRLRDAGETIAQLEQQLAGTGKSADTEAPAGQGPPAGGTALAYQQTYPEMMAESPAQFAESDPKAVFLTFDDGPSIRTNAILDALSERGQRATFFVVGKHIAGNEEILARMVREGHTIGIHGFSHDYEATYASVDAFLQDFHLAYEAVYEACGVYPALFRFPGGSVNAYNRATYQPIIAEMLRRGFVYHDWNVSAEDAGGASQRPAQLVQRVIGGLAENSPAVVLLHDAADKKTTADAVPLLLDEFTALGLYADRLDVSVSPVTFAYSD